MKTLNIGIFLLVGIFAINNYTIAQNFTSEVNKYANWNDPEFIRNKGLWRQYQQCASQNPKDYEGMKTAHGQINEGWWDSGLSTIWVPSEEVKEVLIGAIVAEINKIKVLQREKMKAYRDNPKSASCNYCGQYFSAFEEYVKMGRLGQLQKHIRIGKEHNSPTPKEDNNNDEKEFLSEIAKINADIAEINNLALNRQIIISFAKSQQLCDKLSKYQGSQYFSTTLKKIRKENPGFSFSITPLADQVTPEYWEKLRKRANIAYRKATEAYSGLVWNEGIQTYSANVEIPFRFTKATYDLVTNFKSLFDGQLWGSIDEVRNSYGYQENAVQLFTTASVEALKAGEDVKDWKSYIGVAGGLLSAVTGYKQVIDLVNENDAQNGLIIANRETAEQLKASSKNLLQQFDRYRAYIDSHSSSIDCLNDRIRRIDIDNRSIKGDKITIWGTGLYDWDGEDFLAMIKEAGEDLKNEYIYCEDFIKTLQIAVNLATTDYYVIEEKLRNSGADITQINAQLSANQENGDYFDDETSRLSEYYIQYCDIENNNYPEDLIIVSNQVVPGVEDQDVDPNKPPVWEYESDINVEPLEDPPHHDPHDNSQTFGGGGTTGIISSGNGWSAQKTSTNETSLQNDITSAVNSGKTPAGIYVGDGGEVVVYYIDDNTLGMTSWNLENYNDATTLQNGITSNIEQGYFPMGISFTESGQLFVLYIMSQLKATGWQLVESELELSAVSENIQPYIHEKYIPVGITVFGGMYYTLLVQVPGSEQATWTIEGYEDNNYSIQQGIDSMINKGLVPFGYLKEEEVVNLLYVGF